MKVKELRELLNSMPETHDNEIVCVSTKNPSVGQESTSNVENANSGFDWDNGKFIIRTEHPLIKINWNRCSDGLPCKGQPVWLHDGKMMDYGALMTDDDRKSYKGHFDKECSEQTWDNANWFSPIENNFTHWMYKFDFPRPIK